ncbi:uncharacterized protein MELLADRAFT_66867 [Melampsora larici-populina 98AG31]|uniref:Secreted protein n=1 Tax=Melampsora larici-populina (strain 98AG31 / pathotype 3-4-7) TaxID=747676 RepID=F4S0X6_MELLP|nr:uncharacterized protein MELLADRAFT_66867 [Melampsora larici-populina 98AG31]EGG01732.1 secreted protein [Melampsora larici-populina 98AG31]
MKKDMKSSALLYGFLFGMISQISAAILRVAEPSALSKGALHSTVGESSSPVHWSSSFTEMQERIAEGKRLASLPPSKLLDAKSPLSPKNEKSLLGTKDSLDPSKSKLSPTQAPAPAPVSTQPQHLDVNSEQYKIMKLAHGRYLKGGSHGGSQGTETQTHGLAFWTAVSGHNAAPNAPFSTKLTWIFLAGNLALLRRLFDLARF